MHFSKLQHFIKETVAPSAILTILGDEVLHGRGFTVEHLVFLCNGAIKANFVIGQQISKEHISKSKRGHTNSIGSKNSSAKFTEGQVKEMRELFAMSDKSVETKKKLAIQFNITYRNLSQILSGRRWKHVK